MFKPLLLSTVALACIAGCASADRQAGDHSDAVANVAPSNCIRTTASRIPPGPHECQNAAGRTYSGDDFQRTGQTNTATALGMLDTSVTPRH
ncbi:MAG TPA: hypothetical protein VIY54_12845 [Steroidobacteraceae bacterium]